MSYTEEEGEPPEEVEEDYDSIFQFFSQFTKQLLLELPSPDDRTSAALWIQRLETEPETEEEKRLRVDYLKLFLFVMQRGRLIGMFRDEPPSGPLPPFPDGLGLVEMGNFLLEQAELQGSGDAEEGKVLYNVEISNDLREFVAAQEIPDFGIQVYYAWSAEDPIYKWMSFDENKFPHHVREKIRQLRVAKSEEKADMKSGSLHGEKTDLSLRRSCDSTIYEKNRPKVKSPEEIEKCLIRNRHSFSNYSSQRGSMKDKALDDDKSCSSSRKSRNHSPDEMSLREMGARRLCGQGSNIRETEDEETTAGTRRGVCCPGHSENANAHKSGGCPHSVRKRDTDSCKRLQKCDDAVANSSSQVNESSYMAGPSQRITDKCHGKEMYSESPRCNGEAGPPQKTPCSPARGYQMNQGMSQPSMKPPRKSRCPTQGYQNQQEDLNKSYGCPQANKVPSAPTKSPCSCTCPKPEKATPCFKKKEKSQSDKTYTKSKPPCPCPEPAVTKKPQEHPCPVMESMKSCSQKIPIEPPEGCTCGEGRHKHQQLDNFNSRMGREKMMNEVCPQEVAPQNQQHTCHRKKSDKRERRLTEQPEPGSCSKNRSSNAEEMKKRPDPCQEFYTSQKPQHQPMNNAYCMQGGKMQDSQGHGRTCPGEYPPSGPPPCPRNPDCETKMQGRSGKEGEYMDKRCDVEVKEMKHSQGQGQEYLPGNDFMPCNANKRAFSNYTYPYTQDLPPPPPKTCANVCTCGMQNQNQNPEEDFCGNGFSGSEENLAEEADGEDDCGIDQNNPDDCQMNFGADEEGNSDCAWSMENMPPQSYPCSATSDYPKLPAKIRPDCGASDNSNKYQGCTADDIQNKCPGGGSWQYGGAEQGFPQQQAQASWASPHVWQKCPDQQQYMQPCRRKQRMPDTRDPSCNKLGSPQQSRHVVSSTPIKEADCHQPFIPSGLSTIPQSRPPGCGHPDMDDSYIPLHGGKMCSTDKENMPGGRKKDFQCTQPSSSQLQFVTLQNDQNENQDMGRMMHCSRRYKC